MAPPVSEGGLGKRVARPGAAMKCETCSYPFDEGDRIYWSEAEGGAFCSKACAADAWTEENGNQY